MGQAVMDGDERTIKALEGFGIVRPFLQSDLWAKAEVGDNTVDGDDAYLNPAMRRALETVLIELGISVVGRLDKLNADLLFRLELIDSLLLPDSDIEDWVREIADVSRAQISLVLDNVGTDAIRSVGVEASFNLENVNAQNYLSNASRRIGTSQTDQYRAAIRRSLTESFNAGENIGQTASRLQERVPAFSRSKAEVVARTETAFAHVNANEMGWIQSGVVHGKAFVLAPDACPYCKAAAERLGDGFDQIHTVPLGTPLLEMGTELQPEGIDENTGKPFTPMKLNYSPDGQGLTVPPVHPNCRCSLRPVLLEDETP